MPCTVPEPTILSLFSIYSAASVIRFPTCRMLIQCGHRCSYSIRVLIPLLRPQSAELCSCCPCCRRSSCPSTTAPDASTRQSSTQPGSCCRCSSTAARGPSCSRCTSCSYTDVRSDQVLSKPAVAASDRSAPATCGPCRTSPWYQASPS